jgi:hypothetical protein
MVAGGLVREKLFVKRRKMREPGRSSLQPSSSSSSPSEETPFVVASSPVAHNYMAKTDEEKEELDSEDKSVSPLLRMFLDFLAITFLVLLPFLSVLVDSSVLFGELAHSLAYSGVIWQLTASIVSEGISFVTRGRSGGRKHVEEPSARERSEE